MKEKENIVTVDYLLSMLKKLSDAGKGDMKIKCMDNPLHEDEITINYTKNEILLRGYIFNFQISDKVRRFCDDIEKAKERFYMREEGEGKDNE